MTINPDISAMLDTAERAKSAEAWEALARQLLAAQPAAPRARRAAKVAGPDAGQYLTNEERRARDLPPFKDSKIGGGSYVWALVEFADGVRILRGQYPRAKTPDDLTVAIIGARFQYLRTMSGGDRVNASAVIPEIASVRRLTDADEIEAAREECFRQRAALETFALAPYWDGDTPRPIEWVKSEWRACPREQGGIYGAPICERGKALNAILEAHYSRPVWWRATYRPALPEVEEPEAAEAKAQPVPKPVRHTSRARRAALSGSSLSTPQSIAA